MADCLRKPLIICSKQSLSIIVAVLVLSFKLNAHYSMIMLLIWLLHQVQLLEAEDAQLRCCDVLLQGGQLSAIGAEAASQAQACGARVINAQGWLLAPPLVDPHSELEDPAAGSAETLASLERSALAAGYGTVALLPRALSWRDRPERLQGLKPMGRLQLLLWGSFSQGASGVDLAAHADQLAVGAIGLAEGDQVPPMALLERGFTLAECGSAPLIRCSPPWWPTTSPALTTAPIKSWWGRGLATWRRLWWEACPALAPPCAP